MAEPEDFAWFEEHLAWCHALRILFAKGRSWQQMVQAFGLDPAAAREETLLEQGYPKDSPTVRAGEHEGWGYTIQTDFDSVDVEQLERLSIDGDAFELIYTLMSCPFRYAAGGVMVSGFDMTAPHFRVGDERRFEAELAEAVLAGVPRPRIIGPRFVRLAFGVTIPPAIEGPLPSVALQRAPREPLRSPPSPPPPPIKWPGLG